VLFSSALLATAATPAYVAAEIAGGRASARTAARHSLLAQLFVAAMATAVLAANLGGLWIAIEATTICTAFLVGQRRTKTAVEAAWKRGDLLHRNRAGAAGSPDREDRCRSSVVKPWRGMAHSLHSSAPPALPRQSAPICRRHTRPPSSCPVIAERGGYPAGGDDRGTHESRGNGCRASPRHDNGPLSSMRPPGGGWREVTS